MATLSFPLVESVRQRPSCHRASASAGDDTITIVGYGSLLSERSSRLTFPKLQNFRLGRIKDYRRVFAHPASIFFQRAIANLETLEMSSLSAEHDPGNDGFVVSLFEVSTEGMLDDGVPSQAYLEREEEFDIVRVRAVDVEGFECHGFLCAKSTDDAYIERWGKEHFEEHYHKYGVDSIWGWSRDSGLLPCAVYLRHCYLAAKSMGDECLDSFLDDTYLVDRTTTIREYMQANPHVLDCTPPPELAIRYSG